MDYKVIQAVSPEPISLALARLQCKVDSDDTSHDGLLATLIAAARAYAEHYCSRAIGEQTLEMPLDEFPCSETILLARGPALSVVSVKYIDPNGDEQTLDSGSYSLDTYSSPGRVVLGYAMSWPSTQCILNAVKVRYTAGDVPAVVKQAMLLHIEVECPLLPHTPAERQAKERARDALLDVVKVY